MSAGLQDGKNLPWAISRWVCHCLQIAQKPFGVNCSVTNSKYGTKHHHKEKHCLESNSWAGTLFQLVRAEDERSEDAGGLMLELLLWNMLILLIAIFFQVPFPSCLDKAALHVDWGRGNPVCSCHRPVMNHYPVIWLLPPSPRHKGRRRVDLEEETTVETST